VIPPLDSARAARRRCEDYSNQTAACRDLMRQLHATVTALGYLHFRIVAVAVVWYRCGVSKQSVVAAAAVYTS